MSRPALGAPVAPLSGPEPFSAEELQAALLAPDLPQADAPITSGQLLGATRRAAEAASAGDLEAVHAALNQRASAIASATPEERADAFAQGAAAAALLHALRRRIVLEKDLLERHMPDHPQAHASCLDLRA